MYAFEIKRVTSGRGSYIAFWEVSLAGIVVWQSAPFAEGSMIATEAGGMAEFAMYLRNAIEQTRP